MRQVPTSGEDYGAALLRGLIGALHPFDSRDRRVVVLQFYGDISGHSRAPVIVAAGYLGTAADWQAADAAWNAALQDAGVAYFHATDFFACYGEFAGWAANSERHRAVRERFAAVAADCRLYGFAYGIDVVAFKAAVRPLMAALPKKHRIASVRLAAVNGCLAKVIMYLDTLGLPRNEYLSVFLEHEQGIGEVVDYIGHAKRRREEWARWIVSIAPVDKRVRPVQVADLLAHQAWQYITQRRMQADSPVSPTLRQLGSTKGGFRIDFADTMECMKLAHIVAEYAMAAANARG